MHFLTAHALLHFKEGGAEKLKYSLHLSATLLSTINLHRCIVLEEYVLLVAIEEFLFAMGIKGTKIY